MKTTSGQDALTTPPAHGEWTFEHDADGDFGIYWGNKHICTTVSDTTEDEAHARLIIAAPDMLAALKDAKREIEYLCEQSTLRFGIVKTRQAYLNIDAAIAKAGGQ